MTCVYKENEDNLKMVEEEGKGVRVCACVCVCVCGGGSRWEDEQIFG